MSSIEQTEWPGDSAIARNATPARKGAPWRTLLASLTMGVAGVVIFLALVLPEFAGMAFRAPLPIAAVYNLFGPWGVLGLFELLAVGGVCAAVQEFRER